MITEEKIKYKKTIIRAGGLKNPLPLCAEGGLVCLVQRRLWASMLLAGFYNIRGLGTLGALSYFELKLFAFLEGFKALAGDGCVMDENVLSRLLLDKAKTLAVVEPLYSASCHYVPPCFLVLSCSIKKTVELLPASTVHLTITCHNCKQESLCRI